MLIYSNEAYMQIDSLRHLPHSIYFFPQEAVISFANNPFPVGHLLHTGFSWELLLFVVFYLYFYLKGMNIMTLVTCFKKKL